MLPIVTPAEMRAIDEAAPEPVAVLIDRAARRVVRAARQMLQGVYGRRVVVVAGPGNNGADGRRAGELLERAGVRVEVVAPGAPIPRCDLVIDAAFGTGLNRGFDMAVVPPGAQVLAVDIPSGVDGLTGRLHGAVAPAQRTVTFAALKPGLLLSPGAELCGDIEVADIGLDVRRARAWLFTAQDARAAVPHRASDDHKWRRAVRVVGGSPGMAGAPRLAARAAHRSTAGYVLCQLPGGIVPSDGGEVVYEALPTHGWASTALDGLDRFHSLVVGPGLAADVATEVGELVAGVPGSMPMVIDGTALRLLDGSLPLRSNAVLTPHDGEFEALMGVRPGDDRFEAARSCATMTGATVLLKGPLTIVATPDGRAIACAHGDARLATAGSGDVLAGVIGALLAAGLEPLRAAAFGAWLHADAARHGPAMGLVASDLLPALAHSLTELTVGVPGGGHATN